MSHIPASLLPVIQEANMKARGASLTRIRRRNLSRPAAAWVSKSRIGNTVGSALSVVLATSGCSHARGESGGCTMCSYLLDGSHEAVPGDKILQQFRHAIERASSEKGPLSIKVYTSGSFLDEDEVPTDTRNQILDLISEDERVSEVVLESRPQYVTEDSMGIIYDLLDGRHVEIGVGLESSSDAIRTLCINKGFETEDFAEAVTTAKAHKIGIRAYVLLKPPFLTERDALLDSVRTIEDAAKMGVTTISVNPVNVQKHTLVERLWTRGLYRPPWLWTLVEVLSQARAQVDSSVNIVCDPVAAGKKRGVHNCRRCDESITMAVRNFSLNQKTGVFDALDCDCRHLWSHTLEHEDFALLVHSIKR
ncbi:MAG: archaeosine biosynthesis radical SAM protein RaSEA [Candidatus Thorarchaeota archaeon]|nr:MAG: archaeosine biosynthesis radical SAM protein RaSEA [Candidatus Thorarchaeota archaeon]